MTTSFAPNFFYLFHLQFFQLVFCHTLSLSLSLSLNYSICLSSLVSFFSLSFSTHKPLSHRHTIFISISNPLSFKNGPTPASFSCIFGLFKQTLQYLQQINGKNLMYIKYNVPGFKPMTSQT